MINTTILIGPLLVPLTCFSQLKYQDTIKIAIIYDKPHTDTVFTEIGWVIRRNYQGQMKEIKWLLSNKEQFPTNYKLSDWGYFKD